MQESGAVTGLKVVPFVRSQMDAWVLRPIRRWLYPSPIGIFPPSRPPSCSYLLVLVRTLRREIGSLPYRIRGALATRIYQEGLLVEPLIRNRKQCPVERQSCRDACSEEMRNLIEQNPALTLLDGQTIVRAWSLGADYILGTLDAGKPTSSLHSEQPSKHLTHESREKARCEL